MTGGSPRFPPATSSTSSASRRAPRAHTVGLTEERAAQVVQQSGGARSIAFLVVLIIALFIPVYWFYDLGVHRPGHGGPDGQEAKATQFVTDVKRGYALFLANCATLPARRTGDGKGGIGPPLNDQDKLYNAVTADGKPGTGHLNPNYIRSVLRSAAATCAATPRA